MHFLPFLRAGSKRNNSVLPIIFTCFIFIIALVPLSGIETGESHYSSSDEGSFILTYFPDSLTEAKIKKNIEQGQQSEIYITYRIQQTPGSFLLRGGEYQEVNIRRTGFRDKITGDYILLLNDREIAVYRDWSRFFIEFSSPVVYPSRVAINREQKIQVRVKVRIIYKKLVPPFSIMYLIPGKFMHKHPWRIVLDGEAL